LTKFKNKQILLSKISHRFPVTTKIFSGWKILLGVDIIMMNITVFLQAPSTNQQQPYRGQCYKTFIVRKLWPFVISWNVFHWQAFPAYSLKCSSLVRKLVNYERKKFYNIGPRTGNILSIFIFLKYYKQCILLTLRNSKLLVKMLKNVFFSSPTLHQNKLVCWSLLSV
jgi:hypothetical protein